MSTASGADVVRARAIEILNDEGQPVFVATADEHQNGALWGGGCKGQGGLASVPTRLATACSWSTRLLARRWSRL